MKGGLLIFSLLFSLVACQPVEKQTSQDAHMITLDTAQLNSAFDLFKEQALFHRRFKHADIDSLIHTHREQSVLDVELIGKSVEQRAIYKLHYGKGKKTVMLWSQMHGDEPTATMALFDLFNFLSAKGDDFDGARELINGQLDLHFIPMLNPDGAERYMRRNAQHIDLNRDARAAQTVEGALLRTMAKQIKPAYAFNLHDQNIYYNVPGTKNPVSISMLAPAYNDAREVNEVRKGAMQLIVGMHKLLQNYIPDAVAKYDDTHTARGFGDNFQGWEASTVLIESGGMKGDVEKQQLRKLNFVMILSSLLDIAQERYKQYDAKDYEHIPFNASQLHDVVLRNVDLGTDAVALTSDLAIRRSEVTVGRDYFVRGRIEDIGDLAESYGYDEVDVKGLSFIQGKVYPKPLDSIAQLSFDQAWKLLKQGYIAIQVKDISMDRLHNLPLVVYTQQRYIPVPQPTLGGLTNFYLGEGANLRYAVVNGYLIDLEHEPNTVIFKNRVN